LWWVEDTVCKNNKNHTERGFGLYGAWLSKLNYTFYKKIEKDARAGRQHGLKNLHANVFGFLSFRPCKNKDREFEGV